MVVPDEQISRFQSRIRHSTRTLFYWVLAWLLSMALLAFAPELLWGETLALTLVALVLNVLAGLGVVIANTKHLHTFDELHRKILLDAMGITLGVVLIVGVPYSLLEADEVVAFDAAIAVLYVIMALSFLASWVVGLRRYR